MVRALLAVALLALVAPWAGAAAPAEELRGLWVVRTALVSPAAVDRVVDEAAEAGMNALFVQVCGRGDAFYRSSIVPRSVLLERQPRGFDPLARLLARARTRGLAVHAWVNVLLVAHFGQPLPEGHVLLKHPDWAMVPKSEAAAALVATGRRRLRLIMQAGRREGDVEGYYLSPSIPAVPDYLEAVVRELVRNYAVDGLQLDFIRYPGPTFDYSRSALERFRKSGDGDLLGGPSLRRVEWDAFRRGMLTTLATRLSDAARVERPGLVISAAVAPDEAQAVNNKFQDWPVWLANGVLSALCPMAYTPDSRIFQEQIGQARSLARGGQALWAGIGAYRLDLAGIAEKVTLAREAGANGIVLFSHESFEPGEMRRLRDEAFGRQGVAAHADPHPAGQPAGSP